jgi:uncharacterized protein (UPF0264 family)
MLQLNPDNRPGLLVSVRDAREALAALEGGAHVIDVKEPNRGSLGAADSDTIAEVIRAVAGRAPVTAAAGELVDLIHSPPKPMPDGLSLLKIGLAACRALPDWQSRWTEMIAALWPRPAANNHAVAVAYADWRTANSPDPHDVLQLAVAMGAPSLLVDTWDKSAGTLFDHWPADDLASFMTTVHSHGIMLVLAGSLTGANVAAAAELQPDLVAIRTAACDSGRGGRVMRDRVAALDRELNAAQRARKQAFPQIVNDAAR